MKERSGMPYDVVAYEADEAAMMLTPEQEGLFHRLLRRAWMNGSIPDDADKCATICRVAKVQMRRCWPAIRPLWVESSSEPGRLLNVKQEQEREWKEGYSERQAKRGRLGGEAKSRKTKKSRVASAKQALSTRNESAVASPTPPLPTPTTQEGETENPAADNRRVPFIEFFFSEFRSVRKVKPDIPAPGWKALKGLLQRTRGDPYFGIDGLIRAAGRFIRDQDSFVRRQEPMSYFCNHITGYMGDESYGQNGNGNHSGKASPNPRYIPKQ